MSVVRDLSGNNPLGDADVASPTDEKTLISHLGTQEIIVIGSGSLQSARFSRLCSSIRLAPDGDIHYEVGTNPTADANSPFLAANAVEFLPVNGNQRIAIIRDDTATGNASITQDKS